MYNETAEDALIGQIINHGRDAYLDSADIVRQEHLSNRTALFYNLFQSIYDDHDAPEKASWATFIAKAEANGCAQEVKDNAQYFKNVKKYDMSYREFIKTCQLITILGIRRDLHDKHDAAKDALDKLPPDASIEEIIAASEKPIFDYTSSLIRFDDDGGLIGEGAYDYMDNLGQNPRTILGISSGFKIYDALIGLGYQRGDSNFVMSRFGRGKSTWAANVGLHTTRNDIPTLIIDFEMKRPRQQLRLISNMTGVPMNDLKTGSYHKDPFLRTAVLDAATELGQLPFYYRNVAGMDFSEIIAYIRKWIVKKVGVDSNGITNDCLVIIDYFKLTDAKALGKNLREDQALGLQLSDFIKLIVRYDVSALCFAQLNRSGENETSLASISSSDKLGMYAGSVSLWQEKTNDEISKDGVSNGNMKLSILKARDGGGTHDDYISYNFQRDINRITEIDLGSNLAKKRSVKKNDEAEEIVPDL